MSARIIARTPKRETDRTIMNQASRSIGTTQAADDLWEETEKSTPYRIVGNIMLSKDQSSGNLTLMIVRSPGGTSLISDIRTSSLDGALARSVLWHRIVRWDSDDLETVMLDIDVKGMRKLRKGDKIQLLSKASVAAAATMSALLSTFRKLA